MKSFLHHIVDDLELSAAAALKDRCFVFPSRRAAVYFNDLLTKKFADQVFWAPHVLSIEEFIQANTPDRVVIDELRLLLKLYEVYKKEDPGITFDHFYAWGQTLLNDFDEIDRYLVDAGLLYKNLQEVEDIEATFGPGEELIEAIKGFQEVISAENDSKLTETFSKTWATVGKVYSAFNQVLAEAGWAYTGQCYRTLAQNLANGSYTLPYEHVVFAGFNAISQAEEVIIDTLLEKELATVYIDADRYYLDDENEEAGSFLRKMKKHWRRQPRVKWIITDGFKEEKNIIISGVSQKTGQAKAAAEALVADHANTAIALADESLLMPVLYALPDNNLDLNITMGYPVAGTANANLLRAIIRYHASASTNKSGEVYYTVDAFKELISQPAIAPMITDSLIRLSHSKSKYMAWEGIAERLKEAENDHSSFISRLLTPVNSVQAAIETASTAILDLYFLTKNEEQKASALLEEKVIASLVEYLRSLKQVIDDAALNISFETLEKLLNESIRQLKAPFSGEPLADLQVMGFLETRALDFENLIILSVNEDILPAAGNSKTYIPFAIRKAFKLPTFLEHNSIYAYHFYRLLQRAKTVNLIYDTTLSVTGSGEKSRFILQLLNRFGQNDSPVNINHNILLPRLPDSNDAGEPIVIKKEGSVLAALNQHLAGFTHEKPLTPTGLVNYITCSLKYYYARICRLREPEEVSPEIDARMFGNLLHNVLEEVYTPFIGKDVDKTTLTSLIKEELPKIVDLAFKGYDTNDGEVAFTHHLIFNLAKRILQNDLEDTPIHILDLESETAPLVYDLPLGDGTRIPLGGKIDRLDQILIDGQPVTRILDYKTGKVELKNRKVRSKELEVEDYINAYFEDPKFKSGFQIYFYTLLYKRLFPGQEVTGGIFGVKKINAGVEYLRQQKAPLADDVLNEYENRLAELLRDIRNPEVPFTQTENPEHCTYCEFKTICSR